MEEFLEDEMDKLGRPLACTFYDSRGTRYLCFMFCEGSRCCTWLYCL